MSQSVFTQRLSPFGLISMLGAAYFVAAKLSLMLAIARAWLRRLPRAAIETSQKPR